MPPAPRRQRSGNVHHVTLNPHPAITSGAEPIPGTPDQTQAMRRQARDQTQAELSRAMDDHFAYKLYASLRTTYDIVTRLQLPIDQGGRGLNYAAAKQCLDRVKSVVSSWRDQREWVTRRDQMVTALLALRDEHLRSAGVDPSTMDRLHGGEGGKDGPEDRTILPAHLPGGFGSVDVIQRRLHLQEARAIMDQISKIEGHYSPVKVDVAHAHLHVFASGPGVVAGVDLRSATREQRAALRALLPEATAVIDAEVTSEAIQDGTADALSSEHDESDHDGVADRSGPR